MTKIIEKSAPSRPSFVYCLPQHIQGRDTRDYEVNLMLALVRQYRIEIMRSIPDLAAKIDMYEKEIDDDIRRERDWAQDFYSSYSRRDDLPTGKPNHFVPWGATDRMTGSQLALWDLLQTGPSGCTVWETKKSYNRYTHAIAGGMSKLHRAGIAACLTLKR